MSWGAASEEREERERGYQAARTAERRKKWMTSLLFIPLLVWGLAYGVLYIQFNREIGGHIKRAADANSIQLASEELDIAVKRMQERGMTTGYTSILYTTPNEDVGFWHRNLNEAAVKLRKLPATTTQAEEAQQLIKLRQTLLDHKQNGEGVTSPPGIALFPNNMLAALIGTLSVILASVAGYKLVGDSQKEFALILSLIGAVITFALALAQ